MTKLKLAISTMILLAAAMTAQQTKEIQHLKFDNLGWEQLGDKLQRKYVYGEQGMLALFKMDKGAKVPLHQHPNEQSVLWQYRNCYFHHCESSKPNSKQS